MTTALCMCVVKKVATDVQLWTPRKLLCNLFTYLSVVAGLRLYFCSPVPDMTKANLYHHTKGHYLHL